MDFHRIVVKKGESSKLKQTGIFSILGKGPRAFQIGKISTVKPLNWEICCSAPLQHFLSDN